MTCLAVAVTVDPEVPSSDKLIAPHEALSMDIQLMRSAPERATEGS